MGNHDAAVALDAGTACCPRTGRTAAIAPRLALRRPARSGSRSSRSSPVGHGVTIAHASPDRAGDWLRLDSFLAVKAQFGAFETDVCFVGHSHKPAVVSDAVGVSRVRPGHRYLVNVGTVGQPRDHDPRASFGLFDTEAMHSETRARPLRPCADDRGSPSAAFRPARRAPRRRRVAPPRVGGGCRAGRWAAV